MVTLTEKESELLGFIISSEIGDLVNEYDPDTLAKPIRSRYRKFDELKKIYDRWAAFQRKEKTAKGLEMVIMSPAEPCSMEFTESEAVTAESLVMDFVREGDAVPRLVEKEERDAAKSLAGKLRKEAEDKRTVFTWFLTEEGFRVHRSVSKKEKNRNLGYVVISHCGRKYIADINYENSEERTGFNIEIYKTDRHCTQKKRIGSVKDIKSAGNYKLFTRRAERLLTGYLKENAAAIEAEVNKDIDWLILSRLDRMNFRYSFSRFTGSEKDASARLIAMRDKDIQECGEDEESLVYEENDAFDAEESTSWEGDWISTYLEMTYDYIDYYAVPIPPDSEWVIAVYVGGINRYEFYFMPKSRVQKVRRTVKETWESLYRDIRRDAEVPAADVVQHDGYMAIETAIDDIGSADIIAFKLSLTDREGGFVIDNSEPVDEEIWESLYGDIRKDRKVPAVETDEGFRMHFPHAGETLPGNWCRDGFAVKCENATVEIGVYREPESNTEYAGTLTLQIFQGDDVIFCGRIIEEDGQDGCPSRPQ